MNKLRTNLNADKDMLSIDKTRDNVIILLFTLFTFKKGDSEDASKRT